MVWWGPFREFRRMARELDRFFEFPDFEELEGYREPLTDVWETEDAVMVTVELPGVNKEDINLNVKGNFLEVKVEKKEEKKEKKEGFRRFERRYQGFYRLIRLPAKVNPQKTEATYNNGILEIKLPKVEEGEKGAQIEVK